MSTSIVPLLDQYNLTDEDVNKQVSDIHMEVFSRFSCKEWKSLPAHLWLPSNAAKDIDLMPVNEKEKRLTFLTSWKEKKGCEATYKNLISALLAVESKKEAESVCQYIMKGTEPLQQQAAEEKQQDEGQQQQPIPISRPATADSGEPSHEDMNTSTTKAESSHEDMNTSTATKAETSHEDMMNTSEAEPSHEDRTASETPTSESSHTSAITQGLFLTGPIPGPPGRRSDVAISNNNFVRVHDSTISRILHYSVGVFNNVCSSIEWGEDLAFSSGKKPSVALINKQGHLYAIEVHYSKLYFKWYYRLGKVNERKKIIKWEGRETIMNSGLRPKVCATDSGKIVVVNEESNRARPYRRMNYHIGKLIISDGNPSITFNESKNIGNNSCLQGVEPDITISENTAILIFRSGFQTISSLVGTFSENDQSITWHDLQVVPGDGINPRISLNSRDYCVESHQTKAGRQICRNHGRISQPEKKIIWGNSMVCTLGEYPAIALGDDGFVVELHKTHFGTKTFQSHGQLVMGY